MMSRSEMMSLQLRARVTTAQSLVDEVETLNTTKSWKKKAISSFILCRTYRSHSIFHRTGDEGGLQFHWETHFSFRRVPGINALRQVLQDIQWLCRDQGHVLMITPDDENGPYGPYSWAFPIPYEKNSLKLYKIISRSWIDEPEPISIEEIRFMFLAGKYLHALDHGDIIDKESDPPSNPPSSNEPDTSLRSVFGNIKPPRGAV